MVRKSPRAEALHSLGLALQKSYLLGPLENDSFTDDLEFAYLAIARTRYFQGRESVPKQAAYLGLLDVLDDERFRNKVRMSREAFAALLIRIEDDAVFRNNSRCSQAPVRLQLVVALSRFGHSGTGSRIGKIARTWGILEGAVVQYTKRVIVAICRLAPRVIYWPSEAERKQIKEDIHKKSWFPECVGFVDGTHLPIYQRPAKKDAEDYFNRKRTYLFNVMIVNDHQKRIRYTTFGHCGSAHDTRVWDSSDLSTSSERYFTPEEYLLADSGYPNTNHTVCSFKAPLANEPTNAKFNNCIAGLRVCNEHCIGMLKARFPSLTGLRLVINERTKSLKLAQGWFLACCVLHNLLLDDGWCDNWTVDDQFAEIATQPPSAEAYVSVGNGSSARREE
ncbi:hypothetical protein PhCBS80983_g05998, partial [Powellomyces hirtus]